MLSHLLKVHSSDFWASIQFCLADSHILISFVAFGRSASMISSALMVRARSSSLILSSALRNSVLRLAISSCGKIANLISGVSSLRNCGILLLFLALSKPNSVLPPTRPRVSVACWVALFFVIETGAIVAGFYEKCTAIACYAGVLAVSIVTGLVIFLVILPLVTSSNWFDYLLGETLLADVVILACF